MVYTVVCLLEWDILTAKNHQTNWTPWSRTVPEKLKDLGLVNKFPAFCETRRFITEFTSARPVEIVMQIISPYPHFSKIYFNIMEEPYFILFFDE
jgi:hypothetical protein